MNLTGKFTADLDLVATKRTRGGGREAYIDLDFAVDKETAASIWGADFATAAFSSLVVRKNEEDDGDGWVFLTTNPKPSKAIVFENHQIEFSIDSASEVLVAQPEFRTIKTKDGRPQVVARVRIPIDVGRTSLLQLLHGKVGSPIKLQMNPKQMTMAFVQKPDGTQEPLEATAEEALDEDGDELETDDDLDDEPDAVEPGDDAGNVEAAQA